MTENMDRLKSTAVATIRRWMDGRIEGLVESYPKLAVAEKYMKRGAHNYLARGDNKIASMIDGASLFLFDEEGNLDMETIFDDMLDLFSNMEEQPFEIGPVRGRLGKGALSIDIPENMITSMLFGDTGTIRLTKADFVELKTMFTADMEGLPKYPAAV